MLSLICKLFENLNNNKIRYCHWKSNVNLEDTLNGKTDIDVLVDRRHFSAFESVIASMKFKMAKKPDNFGIESTFHYFGLDEDTGIIIHLHVYCRIITCGSLLKNYHLPLEEMLLQNTRYIGVVCVPAKAAELTVFVIRKILEHTSFVEMLTFYKEYDAAIKDMMWLWDVETETQAVKLVQYWLAALDKTLFLKCINALKPEGSIVNRIFLAQKMRSCLKTFKIYGSLESSIIRSCKLMSRITRKIFGHKKKKKLITGGAVIGIVGPEATGKSTIQKEINHWLGDYFYVVTVHAGKPPSTWLSFLPNLLIPFIREKLPLFRSNNVKKDLREAETGEYNQVNGYRYVVFCLRSIILAFDRYKLLRKVFKKASKGAIVICDRYPTYEVGVMDSPQLCDSAYKLCGIPLGRIFTRWERRFYNRISPADIIIHLSVSCEVAIERNYLRNKKGKTEDEAFVKQRHREAVRQKYISGSIYNVNTDKSLSDTVSEVKRVIWESL